MNGYRQRIVVDQIPRVTGKLSLNVVNDTPRTKDSHLLFPVERAAKQVIEADEMIDMGMRDKDVGEFVHIAQAESVDPSQVEKQGPALVPKANKQHRVLKWTVDQSGMKGIGHRSRIYSKSSALATPAERNSIQPP